MYGVNVTEITFIDVLNRLADEAEDRRQLHATRAEDDYVPWDEVRAASSLLARPESPQ